MSINMLNIALFGPPGAGKGTQSKLLQEKYQLTYLSTGEILRKEIAEKTELGMAAKKIIDRGELVSDELIFEIVGKRISKCLRNKGMLFDGFPRTVVQAEGLEKLLSQKGTSLTCMLSLEVPQEELIKRMLERSKLEGRSDDTPDVINFRMQEYKNKTAPVACFYKSLGKYHTVDGFGTISEVFGRVTRLIESVYPVESSSGL